MNSLNIEMATLSKSKRRTMAAGNEQTDPLAAENSTEESRPEGDIPDGPIEQHPQQQPPVRTLSRYLTAIKEFTQAARTIAIIVVIIVIALWTLWTISKAAITTNETSSAAREQHINEGLERLIRMVSLLALGQPLNTDSAKPHNGQHLAKEVDLPIDYELRYTRVAGTEQGSGREQSTKQPN
jgi:hypothetical protein